MRKNNIPVKAAAGYAIVAVVLLVIIALAYDNSRSLRVIGESVGNYAQMQQHADSAMERMLDDERASLRELSEAIALSRQPGALHRKVSSLSNGRDSVVVHPKATEAHHVSTTTVEVARSRRGFFHRLADLFRSAHADTVSVRRDSSLAAVDTVAKRVDISRRVAGILADAEREEARATQQRQSHVEGEMAYLRAVTQAIAEQQAKKVEQLRKEEQKVIDTGMARARQAHKRLVMQMVLLAALAIALSALLLWRIWRDTQREQAYREELEHANEETRRVMEQRERLLLTITHDIKAPAASITGFTDVLRDYVPSDKGRDLLQSVHDSAVHLSRLVASLLDYHRLESGEMAVSTSPFSPSRLFAQCAMAVRRQAEAKGLRLDVDLSGCDGLVASGDAFRIRQIADNLLGNAVKYTDEGSVTLVAAITNGRLTFSVQDTGRGMTQEECRQAFEPFKRLAAAQGTEGTGLGLSIVTRLATLLGGTVSVKSEPGKSTAFYVVLPVKDVEKATDDVAQGTGSIVSPQKTELATVRHLLILDDDPLQLKLLQEMVGRLAGPLWTVTACGHVTEALTVLHDHRPTLMLMDIEMPEMSGTDFIRHIDHHDIKVVAMTAHDESILPQLREAGFDACLFKPVKADELGKMLGSEPQDSNISLNEKSQKEEDHAAAPVPDGNPLLMDIDEDDRQQIMETLRGELDDFRRQLDTAIAAAPDRKAIARVAHKLLPLAKMLGWGCTEDVEAVAPEHIKEVEERQLKEKVAVVRAQLDRYLVYLTQSLKDTERKD